MNPTRKTESAKNRLAVDSFELQSMLGCGRGAAREIGEAAGARVQIGRRVLWNVDKVREYLYKISN